MITSSIEERRKRVNLAAKAMPNVIAGRIKDLRCSTGCSLKSGRPEGGSNFNCKLKSRIKRMASQKAGMAKDKAENKVVKKSRSLSQRMKPYLQGLWDWISDPKQL